MERITECTENVTTDTETESIVSNENFTLRKRKQGTQNDISTLRVEEPCQSSLTKKGLVKLQKDLITKKSESSQDYNVQPNLQEPPLAPSPPPPPPPLTPLNQNIPQHQPQPEPYIGTYHSHDKKVF